MAITLTKRAENFRKQLFPDDNCDMFKAVKLLNGRVLYGHVKEGYYASVTQLEDNSLEFVINKQSHDDPFILAHLFGHLVLELGFKNNVMTVKQFLDSDQSIDSTSEKNADKFAYHFLMPDALFNEVIQDYTVGNVIFLSRVANYFNLPVTYVRKRLNMYRDNNENS